MCSVDDDLDNLSTISSSLSSLNLVGALCRKCREQPADIVLRLKDAYCRNCHLLSVNHKFRASLGKSKLIRPREKVLIACSGSMSCATLLDLINCGLSDTTPKRIMFNPVIVCIDESAAVSCNREDRIDKFNKLKNMLLKYRLPAYFVPLESINSFKSCDIFSFEVFKFPAHSDESVFNNLKEIFNSLKSLTSKEDLLLKLRQNLLVEIAKALECTKILTAETGTDLSVKLISNLAIGRGAHLSLDVGFCDSRCDSIYLLRPLQDLSRKEIAYYVQFKKLDYVFIPSLTSMENNKACSIQKLTENFLVSLQNEFPSTMSTIFRTGEKLSLNSSNKNSETSSCVLCQAPLDINFAESSAFQATQLSSILSKFGKAAISDDGTLSKSFVPSNGVCVNDEQCCRKDDDSDFSCHSSKTGPDVSMEDLPQITCYGCLLTLKEMKNLSDIPGTLKAQFQARLNQLKLKEEIQEFLLE